jgi:hypothetical protein
MGSSAVRADVSECNATNSGGVESGTGILSSAWKQRCIGWTGSFNILATSYILGLNCYRLCYEFTAVVLAPNVASIGNGVTFSFFVFYSFFTGVVVSQLGYVRSLALGHCLFLAFVAIMAACVFVGVEDSLQWPLYLAGACVSGAAQPLEETSIGPLAEGTARLVTAEAKDPDVTVRSTRVRLMAKFTMIVAGVQVVMNTAIGVLLSVLGKARGPHFAVVVMLPVVALIIVLALAMQAFASEAPVADDAHAKKSLRQEVASLCRLWQDPRIWLLSFSPICFGLAEGWRVAALTRVVSNRLGEASLVYLLLISATSQIVFPKPISWLMPKTGATLWVCLGALNYLLMPLLYWIANPLAYNWGISLWYVLMGVGRAVYDVVFKSVALDHFSKDQSPYVFATMNFQRFPCQGLMFFLSEKMSASELAVLLMVAAICIVPGNLAAHCLTKRLGAEAEHSQV